VVAVAGKSSRGDAPPPELTDQDRHVSTTDFSVIEHPGRRL